MRAIEWAALPEATRAAIEAELGAPVVAATTQRGGFSPGLASRLRLADGTEVFLKLVQAAVNPSSIDIHRREARIAAALPSVPECPRLLWSIDAGDWVALAFEYIDGHTPSLPWRASDLDRVLGALGDLSDALTPSPLAVETAGDLFGPTLMQWRDLAGDEHRLARVSPPWRDRLDELVDLEGRWPVAAAGDSLLHFDVRADNVLLTETRVHFVDWPWAAVGARWLDLAAMLPSVAMQGGPDPETVWRAASVEPRCRRRRPRLVHRGLRGHVDARCADARAARSSDVARVPRRAGRDRPFLARAPERLGRCRRRVT